MAHSFVIMLCESCLCEKKAFVFAGVVWNVGCDGDIVAKLETVRWVSRIRCDTFWTIFMAKEIRRLDSNEWLCKSSKLQKVTKLKFIACHRQVRLLRCHTLNLCS